MIILTKDDVDRRAVEMWEAVNAITDEEIKEYAGERAKARIQELREAVSVIEDDDFLNTLMEIAEPYIDEYFEDATDFKEKLAKFKKLIL